MTSQVAYQVLARKWRPKSFASLVGQDHVVRALTHALNDRRLHHAYLFTGTRGVGKTTLARILAKALNCEKGVTATPCGVCSACTEIDAGRFVDLLEVDAATNTKVDEMRQLLENAVYAPTRGRFKVYVIDEVHMLSNSAFNAMLKTLEEPPEHVKFILATTDPQKIPVTVLSRCLQFNLKQMTPPLIAAHLKYILESEQIAAEPGALNLLARSAAGSMRDALSLLDQAIAHGAGKVEEAQVRDMLGTVDLDYLFSILDAWLAGDVAAMLGVADDMLLRSLSLDAALQEMANLFTRLQIAQLAPQAIADDLPERMRLLNFAEKIDPEFVQLGYQIAVHGRKELPLAPDEFAGFVMTLLRLHAFRPARKGEKTRLSNSSPVALAPQETLKAPHAAVSEEKASAPAQTEAVTPPPIKASTEAETEDWHTILLRLKMSGMVRELAQHCELRRKEGAQIVLALDATKPQLLMNKSTQKKLEEAVSEYFGRAITLTIELSEQLENTPAAVLQAQQRERQEQAVAAVKQDEFVHEVIDLFDAKLIEPSIKPV